MPEATGYTEMMDLFVVGVPEEIVCLPQVLGLTTRLMSEMGIYQYLRGISWV
jgi:hypothetical protein